MKEQPPRVGDRQTAVSHFELASKKHKVVQLKRLLKLFTWKDPRVHTISQAKRSIKERMGAD